MKVVLQRWLKTEYLADSFDTVINDVLSEFEAYKVGTITMMFDIYDEDGKRIDTTGHVWKYKKVEDIKE